MISKQEFLECRYEPAITNGRISIEKMFDPETNCMYYCVTFSIAEKTSMSYDASQIFDAEQIILNQTIEKLYYRLADMFGKNIVDFKLSELIQGISKN